MVFFITTDLDCDVGRLLKPYCYFDSHEKTQIFKAESLQAVFIGCQKIELERHTVFIYGKAFPPKNKNLKSCLEEIAQKGAGQDQMNGNFDLIVFNKEGCSSVSLFGDRHGSFPIFFSNQKGVIKISPFFELILKDNRDYRFNESVLLDYLCLGYTLPGESLWKSVQILPKSKYLNVLPLKQRLFLKDVVSKNGKDGAYYSSLKSAGKAFIETIKETLEDEFKFLDIPQLDLTGGADTRILMSCMSEAQLKNLNYRTFKSAFWDNTNYDSFVAKQLAERFHLNHFTARDYTIKQSDFFHLSYLSLRDQKQELKKTMTGMFGSELFGGAVLDTNSLLDYKFSKRIDKIKDRLCQSVITLSDYKKVGSPWDKLKRKIIHSENLFREQDVAQQILLRSQWSSMYSKYNISAFVMPYYYIKSGRVCPYIDTRMIDFFLNCPREFLLNYILYEYVFIHFIDKKWTEIPFYSDMMKFVEVFSKWRPEETVVNDVCAKPASGYQVYFEKNFSPSLFEGAFLEKLSVKDGSRIPEDVLFKICDLICFLSGLQAEE
ncbi:MAG: hypothetical protein OXJ52_01780 [Oligoflexia bacterium]|nr:hypothetical protein [Oligoflexia bacterium]